MSHPTIHYLLALPSRAIGEHPIADTPSVLIAVFITVTVIVAILVCVCVCVQCVCTHMSMQYVSAHMSMSVQRQYDHEQTSDVFLHCSSPYCLETGTLTGPEPSHSG